MSVSKVLSQDIDLKIDIDDQRITGRTTLRVALADDGSVDPIRLYSHKLSIKSVRVNGAVAEFEPIKPPAGDEIPQSVIEADQPPDEFLQDFGDAASYLYERVLERERLPELVIKVPAEFVKPSADQIAAPSPAAAAATKKSSPSKPEPMQTDGEPQDKDKAAELKQPHSVLLTIAYEAEHPKSGVQFWGNFACTDNQVRRACAWVPCADIPFPSQLTAFTLRLTVPKSLTAIASGVLEKQSWADNAKEWRTLHYRVPLPCTPASLVFAVGPFRILPWHGLDSGSSGEHVTSITHFVPLSTPTGITPPGGNHENGSNHNNHNHNKYEDKVSATLAFFNLAFKFLESEALGASFPLPAIQQVFLPPELLRTECIIGQGVQMVSTEMLIDPQSIEQSHVARGGLLRALAHQWFGQVLRPGTLDDSWMLEGLAGWCEEQYIKRYLGKNELGYHRWSQRRAVCVADNGDAPPLAFGPAPSPSPWGPVYGTERLDIQPVRRLKAIAVLGLLERRAGEDLFRKHVESTVAIAVRLATSDPPESSPVDFIEFMNELARGGDFKKEVPAFRERWIYGQGLPHISAGYIYHKRKSVLELVIRQTGSEAAKLSADRAEVVARSEGAGAGVIKVLVRESIAPVDHAVHVGGQSHVREELKVNPEIKKIPGRRGRRRKDETQEQILAQQQAALQNMCPVQFVRIDPGMEWLCSTRVMQQERMWLNQLQNTKDVIAQLEAVQGLGEMRLNTQRQATLKALKDTLEDKDTFYRVRMAAAYSLASLKGDMGESLGETALQDFFNNRCKHPSADEFTTLHFHDVSEYFVAQAVLSAIARCHNAEGISEAEFFLLPLCDAYNCTWIYDDSGVLAALCEGIGNLTPTDEDMIVMLLVNLLKYLQKESASPSPNFVVGEACLNSMLSIANLPSCPEEFVDKIYTRIQQCCEDHNLRLQILARQTLMRFIYKKRGIFPVLQHALEYLSNSNVSPCLLQAVLEEAIALAGLSGRKVKQVDLDVLLRLSKLLNDGDDVRTRHLAFTALRRLQEQPPSLYKPPAQDLEFLGGTMPTVSMGPTQAKTAAGTAAGTAAPAPMRFKLPMGNIPARSGSAGRSGPAASGQLGAATIMSDGGTLEGGTAAAAMEVDQAMPLAAQGTVYSPVRRDQGEGYSPFQSAPAVVYEDGMLMPKSMMPQAVSGGAPTSEAPAATAATETVGAGGTVGAEGEEQPQQPAAKKMKFKVKLGGFGKS